MLKSILHLLILLLSTSLVLPAQVEAGHLLFGANTGLSLNGSNPLMALGYQKSTITSDDPLVSDYEVESFSFNLAPRLGIFPADQLAMGLDLNYSYNQAGMVDEGYRSSQTYIGAGPFVRYYLVGQGYLLPFVEINGVVGRLSSVDDYPEGSVLSDQQREDFHWNVGTGLGMAVSLGPKATLDALLGYYYSRFDETDGDNEQVRRQGLGLKLGFSYYFGSSK